MSLDLILERLQDASAIAFSPFLIVHLASPIAAGLVDRSRSESVASRIQLAARVLYQDGGSREMVFVWLPLTTHVLVGLIRRITRVNRQRRIRAELELRAQAAEPLPPSGRRSSRFSRQTTLQWLTSYLPKTSHARSAYVGIPLLVGHLLSHRLQSNALPSHRSFQFVAFNLQESSLLNAIKYGALVSTLAYHSLVGFDQLFSKSTAKTIQERKTLLDSQHSAYVRLTWLGIIGTVGLGMRKMSQEKIPFWMAKRYRWSSS